MENECNNKQGEIVERVERVENNLQINHCININNEISKNDEFKRYRELGEKSFIDGKFFLLKEIFKGLDVNDEAEKRLQNVNISLQDKNKKEPISNPEGKIINFNLDLFGEYDIKTNTVTLYLGTIKEYLDNEYNDKKFLKTGGDNGIKELIQTIIIHELLHCIQGSNREKKQNEDYINSSEELFARLNLAYFKSGLDIKKFKNLITSYYKGELISLNDYVFQDIVPILDLYKDKKNDLFKLLDNNLIKKKNYHQIQNSKI